MDLLVWAVVLVGLVGVTATNLFLAYAVYRLILAILYLLDWKDV